MWTHEVHRAVLMLTSPPLKNAAISSGISPMMDETDGSDGLVISPIHMGIWENYTVW